MTTKIRPERTQQPMIPLREEPGRSATPSPGDHVRTLIELLRPVGPELARRLVAALLLAPADEREGIVVSIEAKMVELYAPVVADNPIDQSADSADAADEPRTMDLIDPPVQRDGFVEQVIHTYEVNEDAPEAQHAGGMPGIKAG